MGAQTTVTKNRTLGTFSLWAIGVGLVISGESFGWNIGWGITGPKTFFIPVAITALMYYALIKCLIELACVYPEASGSQTYVKSAFGNAWGHFIALAILFEFLFATPAIATSIGEYLGFLTDNLNNARYIATVFMVVFCMVNLFDLSISVLFAIGLTLLAIIELFIFQSAVMSEFRFTNLLKNNYENLSPDSIVRAMPYAIWLLLAIEGISLMTKNVKVINFKKHITIGYKSAFWTLVVLALSVLLLAGGGITWTIENWSVISTDNHPMPAALALILGRESIIVQVFTFIGLFGLIASLQGITLASTTQLQAFIKINSFTNRQKRILSSFLVFIFSLIAIWGSHTAFLIELSVYGAVVMYFGVSISLIKKRFLKKRSAGHVFEGESRIKEINYTHADFPKGTSRWYAVISAIISFGCIAILSYLHFYTFLIFLLLGIIYLVVLTFRKKNL